MLISKCSISVSKKSSLIKDLKKKKKKKMQEASELLVYVLKHHWERFRYWVIFCFNYFEFNDLIVMSILL